MRFIIRAGNFMFQTVADISVKWLYDHRETQEFANYIFTIHSQRQRKGQGNEDQWNRCGVEFLEV